MNGMSINKRRAFSEKINILKRGKKGLESIEGVMAQIVVSLSFLREVIGKSRRKHKNPKLEPK